MNDKRYLVFDFDLYNPGGGLFDQVESFDSVQECFDFLIQKSSDFQQIYDRIEGKEIRFIKNWDFKRNPKYLIL